ncbi:MAG: (Fe-S)-binding protein [Deltaproteobacteria bacterium]|nr:MAG: (Fe-S)-binding protein [Deltaproteobacteria bacterium]
MHAATFMTLLLAVSLGIFARTMDKRLRILFHLRHEPERFHKLGRRLRVLLRFGFGQKRLLDPEEFRPGLAHATIFAAFVILALRSITLFGMAYGGYDFHLPLLSPYGFVGKVYLFLKDVVVLLALLATTYFLYLRLVEKPKRMTFSGEGLLILFLIQGLMVTEILFEAALFLHPNHLAGLQAGILHPAAWLGIAFYRLIGVSDPMAFTVGQVGYWLHCIIILFFLNLLPIGKHFHVIMGLPDVFFSRLRPMGELTKLDIDLEDESGEEPSFGIQKASDLSWKMALDTYACTECGRCVTHCPTFLTDKPLTHRGLNLTIKAHLLESADRIIAEKKEELPDLVPDVVSAETVWACTTCGWCETACPLFIENVPRLIDMRRSEVLMKGVFPEEATNVFKGMETQGNPWGMSAAKRMAWAEGLEIPTVHDNPDFEYLWFVGCAAAYDDRQRKVARAFHEVLTAAKVNYAILGEEETCNGDSARRLGNEYLFQMMAQQNVETFGHYKVKKILTTCPHCFNTFKNEYPQFDGHYDVVHHTQLIAGLLAEGRIQPQKAIDERVTYHDSCYMGRHNEEYEAPRQVLHRLPALKLQEMPQNRRESFCCGAGGGRMWLEEKIGTRINQTRVREAVATGARTIATNCPFCLTMLRDGLNELEIENVTTKDIAELVAESMAHEEEKPAVVEAAVTKETTEPTT